MPRTGTAPSLVPTGAAKPSLVPTGAAKPSLVPIGTDARGRSGFTPGPFAVSPGRGSPNMTTTLVRRLCRALRVVVPLPSAAPSPVATEDIRSPAEAEVRTLLRARRFDEAPAVPRPLAGGDRVYGAGTSTP